VREEKRSNRGKEQRGGGRRLVRRDGGDPGVRKEMEKRRGTEAEEHRCKRRIVYLEG
jgi:hypothetical protein